jgi:uncharacterized Zn finger protein
MSWYREWAPYVSVAERRAKAANYAKKLAKQRGRALTPVKPEGRKIATSFWGQAWCTHLERYSDFANRLPRGRSYIRNGSVIDLQIDRGQIKAIVSGSEIYTVTVKIQTLAKAPWKRIKEACSQSIDSLIDLLQGRFDQAIIERLTQREGGLFPTPGEIKMSCTCPDYATLCKHVAATLYGVGTLLDAAPELFFTLRGVEHAELITQAVAAENLERTLGADSEVALSGSELGEIFGIDLAGGNGSANDKLASGKATRRRVARKRVTGPPAERAVRGRGATAEAATALTPPGRRDAAHRPKTDRRKVKHRKRAASKKSAEKSAVPKSGDNRAAALATEQKRGPIRAAHRQKAN